MGSTPERFDYVSSSAPSATPPLSGGWFSRHWKGVIGLGCLGLTLLILAFIAGIFALVVGSFRSSDVYRQALDKARANPQVVQRLGTPIQPGWWVSGSLNVAGDAGSAELTIPVSGPKGKGKIYLSARKFAGRWRFLRLQVGVEGDSEPIVLVAPAKDEKQDPPQTRDF